VLINDALTALVGRPTFVAMRPTGIMLVCTNQLSIQKIGKSGPYKWQPMFADLVATDWMVFSPEQMREMRAAAAAQAAAQEAGNAAEVKNG
jgi:hypothetical protein